MSENCNSDTGQVWNTCLDCDSTQLVLTSAVHKCLSCTSTNSRIKYGVPWEKTDVVLFRACFSFIQNFPPIVNCGFQGFYVGWMRDLLVCDSSFSVCWVCAQVATYLHCIADNIICGWFLSVEVLLKALSSSCTYSANLSELNSAAVPISCSVIVSVSCGLWFPIAPKGHFTHEPGASSWSCESPKEVSKGCPNHFQSCVVCSQALKCSLKSYMTMSSTKCYFNEF